MLGGEKGAREKGQVPFRSRSHTDGDRREVGRSEGGRHPSRERRARSRSAGYYQSPNTVLRKCCMPVSSLHLGPSRGGCAFGSCGNETARRLDL